MKWTKLGKIFDPSDYNLLGQHAIFSQSPQAIELEDRVRVYFSTRVKDETGKYLSHIAFVDYSKNFENILEVSDKQVIPLGELGTFDEHGIFPISPLKDGNKVLAFTTGWNRKVSVSADASIGLAISDDNGITFKKHGAGPILTASLNEPFLVADAYVMKQDNMYHMWYIFGTQWIDSPSGGEPERVYKIAYACSKDAINWQREGIPIIADAIGEEECQALPTVFFHNKQYHMYFCYRAAFGFRNEKGKGYKIGYAVSDDMKTWQRKDEEKGIEGTKNCWDSDMQCYPYTFECDGQIYMLYNGNEFGRHGFGLAKLESED